MLKKFYLDTCIWRDYFEDRKDALKPLGEFAFRFLKKCVKDKSKIIVSDLVVKELQKDYSLNQIELMFSEFKHLIIEVRHSKEQFMEAVNLFKQFNKKLPFYDILHSIVSRDETAILITRDSHFSEIDLCENRLPEQLI